MKIEELMKLYRKTTPGEWKVCGDKHNKIATEELFVLIDSADDGVFIDEEDLELIVALHNAFPALYNRLIVAEKSVELMAVVLRNNLHFCGFEPQERSGRHEKMGGCACAVKGQECTVDYFRQKALAELGLKEEDLDGK